MPGEGEVVAHLADPGRLRELLVPGRRMGLRPERASETRSTRWTALLVEAPEADWPEGSGPGGSALGGSALDGSGSAAAGSGLARWVSVNTTMPNLLVRRALADGALSEFRGWKLARWEATYGASRLDFLLERDDEESGGGARDAGRLMYVEAKSVTLVEDGVALFPDAVTARGARHLEELIRAVEEGHHAAVLFVLQRPDARRIVAARSIDPAFAETLARAEAAGVGVLGRRCSVGWDGIRLGARVPAGAG